MKRSDVDLVEGASSGTSSGLIRDAQANNEAAWARLVSLYSRRIYRWCRMSGLQPADASNIGQETLHAVVRNIGQFHRDRPGDTFRGWLRRITENKIRDHFRLTGRALDIACGGSAGLERLAHLAIESDGGSNATWDTTRWTAHEERRKKGELAALRQRIEKVRQDISPRDWRFFWRVAVDGQSSAEVGREFGVSANTVRLVKMRVLRKLRDEQRSTE